MAWADSPIPACGFITIHDGEGNIHEDQIGFILAQAAVHLRLFKAAVRTPPRAQICKLIMVNLNKFNIFHDQDGFHSLAVSADA